MLLLAAIAAHAGGLTTSEGGARAIGRAGAWVASADDAEAAWWNPAGLSRLDAPELRFEAALVAQGVVFTPLDGLPTRSRPSVAPIPRLAAAAPLGRGFTGSFGVYAPYGPLPRWSADGPQRYLVTEATFARLDVGPAIAWRRGPVAVGAAVAASSMLLDHHLAVTTALDGSQQPEWDAGTHLHAVDAFVPVLGLGALLDAGPVSLGLSGRSGARYRLGGSLAVDLSQNAWYTGESDFGQVIAAPEARDDDIVVPFTAPPELRGGVAFRRGDLVVEAAVAWEGWSRWSGLRIEGIDLAIPTTGGEPLTVADDIVVPVTMRDAWSARLGGEIERAGIALRAGVHADRGAIPEVSRSALFPGGDALGYGLGTTVRSGCIGVDVGFGQAFVLDPRIERSSVAQIAIDPLTGAVGFGDEVGRGLLAVSDQALAIGFAWAPACAK